MNKVLAEIIAGIIPCKMERNRWRGIFRYGVWNALKLKYRLKHDRTSPKYYLSVCAIAKNEGPYFKEWIEWHRKQGVEKFYIYEGDDLYCVGAVIDNKKTKPTNADRIRAMSDEELAKFIPDWSYTNACKCDEKPYVDCNNECEKCVFEWLAQPAEV